ncbi:hypothetical protein Ngar_c14460 [Candidatus Nitrososphaera gargensis Ga9.2]|uniref:Uncharacterized protein n=1 Tax=Nitrososphaera gargensis (strain Ga9.2) TaxID=1237085 RepID=K0IJE6_NITGG|nr:hypothetical protein [Candidatus Nitrososphaera gargensis]AFU58382.1 hypothetical protein Ngar_c14460 [Candidatus Nitrososphaera gargensis Ga9.2]
MSEISVQQFARSVLSGSSQKYELTGKKKVIYNLLVTSDYNGETIAEKTGTNTEYPYKVVNELKKKGWLPQDFALRDRRGKLDTNSYRTSGTGKSSGITANQSHPDSHNNDEGCRPADFRAAK